MDQLIAASIVIAFVSLFPLGFVCGTICTFISVMRTPESTILEWRRRFGRRERIVDVVFVPEDGR